MPAIDETDGHILNALQKDARATYTDLAKLTNRAESTIRERIQRLEREGVIRGYAANIDPASVGFPVRGQVRADAPDKKAAIRTLRADRRVRSVRIVTGPRPILAEVTAENWTDLHAVADTPGLQNAEVVVYVEDVVEPRPLDVREPPVEVRV